MNVLEVGQSRYDRSNGTIRESKMNRWNIPEWLEQAVRARDTACVYCGVDFSIVTTRRGEKPSWEHIGNDEKIMTPENIARCCIACKACKGAKDLSVWTLSCYCANKGITKDTVTHVVQNALAKSLIQT